jgi:hypothetical protein
VNKELFSFLCLRGESAEESVAEGRVGCWRGNSEGIGLFDSTSFLEKEGREVIP